MTWHGGGGYSGGERKKKRKNKNHNKTKIIIRFQRRGMGARKSRALLCACAPGTGTGGVYPSQMPNESLERNWGKGGLATGSWLEELRGGRGVVKEPPSRAKADVHWECTLGKGESRLVRSSC